MEQNKEELNVLKKELQAAIDKNDFLKAHELHQNIVEQQRKVDCHEREFNALNIFYSDDDTTTTNQNRPSTLFEVDDTETIHGEQDNESQDTFELSDTEERENTVENPDTVEGTNDNGHDETVQAPKVKNVKPPTESNGEHNFYQFACFCSKIF